MIELIFWNICLVACIIIVIAIITLFLGIW